MTYNLHNLNVYRFASTSSIKPGLQCVAFYGDRTIATDSFRMVEMSANDEAHEPILYRADDVKNRKLKKGERVHRDLLDLKEIDAHFPDVDAVFKREFENDGEYTSVKINGALLSDVVKELSKLNTYGVITLQIPHTPNMAVRVTAENKEQKARALVMPVRS